jgi:hypothetical protein
MHFQANYDILIPEINTTMAWEYVSSKLVNSLPFGHSTVFEVVTDGLPRLALTVNRRTAVYKRRHFSLTLHVPNPQAWSASYIVRKRRVDCVAYSRS